MVMTVFKMGVNQFDVVSVDSLKQAQKRLIYGVDGKTGMEIFRLNLLCPKCISSVRGAATFSEVSFSFFF